MPEIKTNLEEIKKGIIPKQRSNGFDRQNLRDIHISYSPETRKSAARINMNFYVDEFSKYKYVTLYEVEKALFFELSNENDNGTAYALSGKKDSKFKRTKIQGENTEKLKKFTGKYYVSCYYPTYYNFDRAQMKKPLFYIVKE